MLAMLTIMLGAGVPAFGQDDFCKGKNTSFLAGEQLFYKVYYNMGRIWVGAGEVSFSVNAEKMQGRNVYHIIGDGRTLKSYEWFYKVRDRYESYVDMETLLPVRFIRNVNEGGFKIYNNVSFNHVVGKATTQNATYKIPRCVQDVLSAIYYARNIDYSKYTPGAKIPFSMFLDDQVYNLYIRYLGKERIETKYGTFNTIKFSPLLINGTIFKGGEKMTVWVTDDQNHVPVRIDSPITVG
ncbi:MAG: DUF3108 domain-containing protein, partial [Sphingobacteriales bacterium]